MPSERSSGDSIRRGSITRAGDARFRRVILQVAWSYRCPPRRSAAVRERRAYLPAKLSAFGRKAQVLPHRALVGSWGEANPKMGRLLPRLGKLLAREALTERLVMQPGTELGEPSRDSR